MNAEDRIVLLRPHESSPGAVAAFAFQSKAAEIASLERERKTRVWKVRAIISDSIPLVGGTDDVLQRKSHHLIVLNKNPLFIYLHFGGDNAVYFQLDADADNKLKSITIEVETAYPSTALLLARQPINSLLDVITRNFNLPVLIQRLELLSPVSGEVLLSEFLILNRNGISNGASRGILQSVHFAPYGAIYREALVSGSPFYRLLCAARMYEGTNKIREFLNKEAKKHHIAATIPPDPEVDPNYLVSIGFEPGVTRKFKRAADLFHKLKDARDAIAHYLIERDDVESHVYLADGTQLQFYSIGASALLFYAHKTLEELRLFFTKHVEPKTRRGMILTHARN